MALSAQAPQPLDKIEVIRLLTNPLFAQNEVADVVRRSCVAFRPTERDWADLRNAGASGEVIATVAACTHGRSEAPPAAPPAAAPRPRWPSRHDPWSRTPAPPRARGSSCIGVACPSARIAVTLRGSSAVGLQRDASGHDE